MSSILETIQARQQQAAASKNAEFKALVYDLATDATLEPEAVAETLERLGITTTAAATAVSVCRQRLAARQRIDQNQSVAAQAPELIACAQVAQSKLHAAELEFSDTMRSVRYREQAVFTAKVSIEDDRKFLLNGCADRILLDEEAKLDQVRRDLAKQLADAADRQGDNSRTISANERNKAEAKRVNGSSYPTPQIDSVLAELNAARQILNATHTELQSRLQEVNKRQDAIRQEKLESAI